MLAEFSDAKGRRFTIGVSGFAIFLNLMSSLAYASAPSQPGQLKAAVYSSRSAEISWSRSTDDVMVVGYELTFNGEYLGQLDQLSYYRKNLTPGERYSASVTAVDIQGNRSVTASTTFVAGDTTAQDELSPPKNLRTQVYSKRSLEVLWDRVPHAGLSYRVYVDGRLHGITHGVSRGIKALQSGRQYRIDVVAVDMNGRESMATSTLVTTNGEPPPPEQVSFTDERISVYSQRSAELFWTRPTGVVSTDIYRDHMYLARAEGTSYYDDERERGVAYRYELLGLDAQGQILARVSIDETPVAPPQSTSPEILMLDDARLTRYSATAAELFWEKASGSVSTQISRDGIQLGLSPGSSFFDDSRQYDTPYEYHLRSIDAAGKLIAQATIAEQPWVTRQTPIENPKETSGPFESLGSDITPERSVYTDYGYNPVNVIRVDLQTVTTPGICTVDDLSGCTLADVMNDVVKNDELTVDIPVHFKSDDFADDGSINNAELRLRGGGSRFAPQKSFRIKLDSKKNLWRGERYLQLNKHPFESSRMRNKLAMDLMSRVPHLPSFRTQFVNLWIDDGQGPVDYGLYTHVERPNDDYLEARALDKDGNLYKAKDFQFKLSDLGDVQVDEDGKPLDKHRFESSLDIEEGKDHRALVAMLGALNDPQQSFQSVLDQYFNRNNVMAWMAVNLLLKQDDGTRHNYILYNPSGSQTFYFLPWDYDAAVSRWRLPPDDSFSPRDLEIRVKYGYALGAENVFMEKFYKLPGIHDELMRTIDYLVQNHLDAATITELSEHNARLIEPFETRLPDSEHNIHFHGSPRFEQYIQHNINTMATAFHMPIPPTLLAPRRMDDSWEFTWQPAYDPTGHTVSYDLELSSNLAFRPDDIAVKITGITSDNAVVSQSIDAQRLPGPGYFVRLIARSANQPESFWTPARNKVRDSGLPYYGVIKFSTE